ncbi:hypothetical protein EYS09_11630 [Streptomyces kasugaensis]|uniref:Transcriptional regulator n=1 Tax=Streptomyces kasugaensis TaxID=1946 RepID=A0A4V2JIR4_STRKA|nr:hypothetical protein [Streptomyces kasugaensis]TBO59531.1 hypothetical protein EYS09_11630 [Streptomyces kasugaensis]
MTTQRNRRADRSAALRRARESGRERNPGQPDPDSAPSPWRDKKFLAGGVLTVVTALIVWAVQSGWGWIQGESADPPQLKAYASGPSGCGARYLKESLAELRKSSEQVRRQGGVLIPTDDNSVSVIATLQAGTDQAIVVTGAKVSVLSSGSLPGQGTVIHDECGGGVDERAFDLDFSQNPVTVKPQIQHTANSAKTGRDFPFKVSSGDPEQFVFHVAKLRRDVRFAITLSWVSDGEPGTTRLDNGGRGYHVMGNPQGLPSYPVSALYKK